MKKLIRVSVLAITLSTLAACGDNAGGNGVKVDTSSDASSVLSMKQMTENMNVEQRQAFERNLLVIRDSVSSSVNTDDLGIMESHEAVVGALKKLMNGMTASDIADKADEIRKSKG